MWPYSGTVMDGMYIMRNGARIAQHLFVFLLAAPAYRVAIAMGWPARLPARLGVASLNTLLSAVVLALSPLGAALATGFVDHRPGDMKDTLDSLASSFPHVSYWTTPLRFFLPPYVLGLCAIALVLVARRQHLESLRAAELARAYSAARLETLSAQLQPHFLFNSLHAISALVDNSPRQAATMLARLGDFLRYALENSHWPWVELERELTGLEAYLELQRTRFADRLSITVDASPESLEVYIPSLLVQPLAENAIVHGRKNNAASLKVQVAAAVVDGRLLITVSNSSPRLTGALSPADYGHGLANVVLRLQAAYGGDARLNVGPDPVGGTTVTLDLPLRRAADLEPAGGDFP
jgi:hypothetical protein